MRNQKRIQRARVVASFLNAVAIQHFVTVETINQKTFHIHSLCNEMCAIKHINVLSNSHPICSAYVIRNGKCIRFDRRTKSNTSGRNIINYKITIIIYKRNPVPGDQNAIDCQPMLCIVIKVSFYLLNGTRIKSLHSLCHSIPVFCTQ